MDNYFEVVKKYAVFGGRARRKEYWMFFLANIIIGIALSLIESVLGLKNVLTYTYILAVLLPGLAVGVRRLHDTNRSGLWMLIGLIPVIGTIILLVLLAQEGQKESNQYGPSSKESNGNGNNGPVQTPEIPPTA